MGVIKLAGKFIKDGKVTLISMGENQILVQVDKYIVKVVKKMGMTLDSCSCTNHAKFNKLNPRCSHKLAAETYLVMRGIE